EVMAYLAVHPERKELILGMTGSKTNELLFKYDTKIIFTPAPYPAPEGCQVHEGFEEVYKAMRQPIREAIQRELEGQCRGWKVVVTGQSLGGATMIYAMVDLATHIPATLLPRHLLIGYGYGTPRVGNRKYAAWVNALHLRIYRITDPQDLIARGLSRKISYASPHREVLTSDNSKSATAVYCDSSSVFGEDRRCSISRPRPSWKIMPHHNVYFGVF
ncbi:MAG: Alpha/Beta hydrolase protein, partial [Piptocephalis tieghemiana]